MCDDFETERKEKKHGINIRCLLKVHSHSVNKRRREVAMAVLHVCLLSLFVVCTTSSYMFSNTIIINNGTYNVSYNFNESADTLEFLVEANATGWVGFGFSLNAGPTGMVGYDVAVRGVSSNETGYLRVSEEFCYL